MIGELVDGDPPRARMEAVGCLVRVFRATEEENRRAIIRTLAPRPGARLLDLGTSEGSVTLRVAERLRAARVAGPS